MQLLISFFVTYLFVLLSSKSSDAARILGVVSAPSYSHQIAYRAIWRSLSQRGHEVVVITTNPMRDKTLTNLTEIDFSRFYDLLSVDFAKSRLKLSWLDVMNNNLYPAARAIAEAIYDDAAVRRMYAADSQQKFDVVLVEMVLTPALYALAHRFNAPLIGLSSLGMTADLHHSFGSPVLPSDPSTWEMETKAGLNLPFWRRVKNYVHLWWFLYRKYYDHMIPQQEIAQKYLGKNIPPLVELERDMSLAFVVQSEIISAVRPQVPKVIPIGGLHISKNPKPLPKDLKEFLDDAKEGFIYVSLGTNAKLTSFSKNIQDAFRNVLSSLPYKVVWKYDVKLDNVSNNIYISSWFSQQSILAHPNIKLFVYQGGIQSTEEAVHNGVPLVGFPILADQDYQVATMERLKVAKRLEIVTVTEESLKNAIMDVILDPRYKEAMMKLRSLTLDRPYDCLEHVIWWIEHVIRHRGASYLQTSIAYEPWYQRYNFDVIAFLSVATFLIILSILYASYKLFIPVSRDYIAIDNEKKRKKLS